MNVFTAYLDSMFGAYPPTPRLLEAKAELQTMMEDAYADLIAGGASEHEAIGQIIADFGSLDELAPVLGISAEIAPARAGADAGEPPLPAGAGRTAAHEPTVTVADAEGFAAVQQRTQPRLAVAFALFVVSPIPLVVLPVAAEAGGLPFGVGVATAIGIVVLLVVALLAVLLVIGISREFAPYDAVQRGRFTTTPEVARWADELAQRHVRRRNRALAVAVAIWILSPVPLILALTLLHSSPDLALWIVAGVAVILLLAAVGLLVVVPAAWAQSAADALNRVGRRRA